MSGIRSTWAILLTVVLLYPSARASGQRVVGSDIARTVWTEVNFHRKIMGKSPLVWNDTLALEAESHSAKMAEHEIPFGHEGFEERMGALLKIMSPANAAAENVADGKINARQAVDVWLKSAGHRKNIEGNFNLTGVGIAQGGDGVLYFTQIFVRKL